MVRHAKKRHLYRALCDFEKHPYPFLFGHGFVTEHRRHARIVVIVVFGLAQDFLPGGVELPDFGSV
jgi:hypothetical protein